MNTQTAIRPAVREELHVPLVTVEVSQGDPELVARLLDTSRDISPSEWSVIEGGL